MPKEHFTDTALDNLKKIISSKEELIKKQLTDSIPVVDNGETISFPWFVGEFNSDETRAYTHFVAAL